MSLSCMRTWVCSTTTTGSGQKTETKWNWGTEQENSFEEYKCLMQSSEVHYDSLKDLILSCDASPYGVGAVLSHRMPDGQE